MKERLLAHWPTTLLAAGCVLAGLWLAVEWSTLPATYKKNPPTQPEKQSKTQITPQQDFSLPPMEQFHALVEMPLFIQGREPPPAEDLEADTATPTITPSNPPKVLLTGILETPDDGTLILLRSADGKHHYRLRPGEKIENWRLSEVTADHVILVNGARKHTLQLIKPRPQRFKTKPISRKRPPQGNNPFTQSTPASRKRNKP